MSTRPEQSRPGSAGRCLTVWTKTLEQRLFPPSTAELTALRPVPKWREVHREPKRKHVRLWLEWREDHPEGWGFSQFGWHYGQWLAGQDVLMGLSYPGGERMFVDTPAGRAPAPRIPASPGPREEQADAGGSAPCPQQSLASHLIMMYRFLM
jgi:hypothetical protein